MARSCSPPKHKNKNTKKHQKSSSLISETKCKRSRTSSVIEDEQDEMQVDESSEDELRMYSMYYSSIINIYIITIFLKPKWIR
jgi:hypothetical protein